MYLRTEVPLIVKFGKNVLKMTSLQAKIPKRQLNVIKNIVLSLFVKKHGLVEQKQK